MAKLRIVYVPTADLRGPDLERIGTVEDIPDELARIMVGDGQAVYAEDDSDEQASTELTTPQAADPVADQILKTASPSPSASSTPATPSVSTATS